MDDAESPRSNKRRASKVSVIVLSDDEDEEDEKSKNSAKSKAKASKKKGDLDDFIAPDEDSDGSIFRRVRKLGRQRIRARVGCIHEGG